MDLYHLAQHNKFRIITIFFIDKIFKGNVNFLTGACPTFILAIQHTVTSYTHSAWDRNTSPISKLGDLFSFPSSPTLVEEFQFLGTSAKGESASAKGTKPN